MSKNYDNWEKLVGAVLKREKLRQLALSHSVSCSDDDDISSFDEEGQLKIQSISLYYDATEYIWGIFLLSQEYHPNSAVSRSSSLPGVVFLPVEAREFVIQTADSPAQCLPYSTRYGSFSTDKRFDALEVSSINLPVDIRGKISTRLLTSKTIYGVYLIFKLGDTSSMYMNNFVEEREWEMERGIENACAHADRSGGGWLEVEIGSFYVEDEGEQEVEARLVETSRRWKGGLIIEGMEFRPLLRVKQLLY